MSNSAELEKIIQLSDGNIDFQNCAGYLILGHQISSMVKNVEVMIKDSREADKKIDEKIDEKLDKIIDKIDVNKEDVNKAALNNEKRLSTVEAKISSISLWIKLLMGVLIPALIAFILKQIGIF